MTYNQLRDIIIERTTELTKCKYQNDINQKKLLEAQARIAELREALEWAEAEVGWRFEDVLGWPDDTNDLAAHDAAIRKATLLEFAYKWLPHLRQESPQSSLAQTEFNLAIDAAVKHALRMAEGE